MLTVGVSGNSKTCYVIPDDPEKYGELVGTRAGNVPEVCRRIAEELGVKVEFVGTDLGSTTAGSSGRGCGSCRG